MRTLVRQSVFPLVQCCVEASYRRTDCQSLPPWVRRLCLLAIHPCRHTTMNDSFRRSRGDQNRFTGRFTDRTQSNRLSSPQSRLPSPPWSPRGAMVRWKFDILLPPKQGLVAFHNNDEGVLLSSFTCYKVLGDFFTSMACCIL